MHVVSCLANLAPNDLTDGKEAKCFRQLGVNAENFLFPIDFGGIPALTLGDLTQSTRPRATDAVQSA